MSQEKLNKAYRMLNELVISGIEFPDACSRAASMYSVGYDSLRHEYDEREGDRKYDEEFAIRLIEKFPKYVMPEDDVSLVIKTSRAVIDRINIRH